MCVSPHTSSKSIRVSTPPTSPGTIMIDSGEKQDLHNTRKRGTHLAFESSLKICELGFGLSMLKDLERKYKNDE